MATDYKTNIETYEEKYTIGYGHEYPDGHVIRIHRHVLMHELGLNGGRILDYGCGTGVYLKYFTEHGFEPYGCDISALAIEKCKQRLPRNAENFHVIPAVPTLGEIYREPFDFVFSNQTLYYLNDQDMDNVIAQLVGLLKPGGVFYASMISPQSYYTQRVEGVENGLSKVVLRGRINEETHINFKDRDQVGGLFAKHGLKKVQLGWYGYLIREDEGPRHHHFFVGTK